MKAQKYDDLTSDERRELRELYVSKQEWKCWYCGGMMHKAPPAEVLAKHVDFSYFPPNFLKYPIHLHHDHITGLTLGAVHAYCNAVLWQYEGQ